MPLVGDGFWGFTILGTPAGSKLESQEHGLQGQRGVSDSPDHSRISRPNKTVTLKNLMTNPVDSGPEIMRLLAAHRGGDTQAVGRIFELVYGELRRLAHFQRVQLPAGETLNTTGLVHEAYLKVAGSASVSPGQDRGHFFNIAAQAMRQILVDAARSRMTQKRGSGQRVETLNEQDRALRREAETLIDLDRALTELARLKPRPARVFECRYFAGLGLEETAAVVAVSLRTAERDWVEARTWLRSRLERR